MASNSILKLFLKSQNTKIVNKKFPTIDTYKIRREISLSTLYII